VTAGDDFAAELVDALAAGDGERPRALLHPYVGWEFRAARCAGRIQVLAVLASGGAERPAAYGCATARSTAGRRTRIALPATPRRVTSRCQTPHQDRDAVVPQL